MEDSFVELLASLGDETKPVERSRLAELSDLDQEHLRLFADRWNQLSEGRRQSVLQQLGLLADSQIELTFEAINRLALNDADPAVRTQAIENLWESEDPALVEPLLARLTGDRSDQVRAAAASALGSFMLLGETQQLSEGLTKAIESGLLNAAQSDSIDQVRDRALEALGFSSRAEVPDLIEAAYRSGSEARLRAALRAMARSASLQWAEHVQTRLNHPSPDVRLEAVVAAGEIEARHVVQELIELIEDVDLRVRKAAIWSLGQLGGKLAADTLASLIETVEDEAEQALIEDALDNLDFIESTRELLRSETNGLEGSAG